MAGLHRTLAVCVAAWAGVLATAQAEWRFEPAKEVSPAATGVFHHLEAAGRRSLAVSDDTVALVWEDNRTGGPRVYAAVDRGEGFGEAQAISGAGESFEPVVAGLGAGRFLIAWEEDGRVRLCILGPDGPGPAVTADEAPSVQPGLTEAQPGRAFAAWIRRDGRYGRVVAAAVDAGGETPEILWSRPAESGLPADEQLYPTLASGGDGLVLGWEDRRAGHTRLYTVHDAGGGGFTEPRLLNEVPASSNPTFGRGTGVTRLALSAAGERVVATWMDKRDFRGGYDTYAAVSNDGGRSFGPNERVQDLFGENQPQWHPAVAVAGTLPPVVVWDDPRDGTPDLWMSWRLDDGWSDDLPVPGGHGPGAQANPVAVFDDQGRLHLAWIDRGDQGTRILYATAVWSE